MSLFVRALGLVVFLFCCIWCTFAQPIGDPITLISDTPTYADVGLHSIAGATPVVLARSAGEDREPKIAILNDGSTVVFWVNRNGSHHVNGIDAAGNLLAPVVTEDPAIDILVGINTGTNTNWTLCKADHTKNTYLAAATFLAETLTDSEAELPSTIVDANGNTEDNSQGHGFFKLFQYPLNPSSSPISISEFSAGHREWDCCWLNDGKFVIGTISHGHEYSSDPDWITGGTNVATLNIFNADGSRFMNEFFINDLAGEQMNLWLGTLSNGFVCVYEDNTTLVGGEDIYKGIIFTNEGMKVKEFVITDTVNGIQPSWMAAGGGQQFVTVHALNAPDGIGLPPEIVGMPIVMAQRWNDQGERVGPYILVSQHNDFRSVERPRCAMARNGSFACSWIDNGADIVQFTDSVIARTFNADGTPVTNAFVAHPIPEFEETAGGNASEAMLDITNDRLAITWATLAAPEGQFRDIALMVYGNAATPVESWDLF